MSKRKYTHVERLLAEMKAMLSEGKTQREIAEHLGFADKYVVKGFLKRQRRKEAKLIAGVVPNPRGRPRKDGQPRDLVAKQAYEIDRLRMENTLLWDFLHCVGRK